MQRCSARVESSISKGEGILLPRSDFCCTPPPHKRMDRTRGTVSTSPARRLSAALGARRDVVLNGPDLDVREEDYLNCCASPSLATVRALYESCHDDELLRRCTGCGAYWFYRFHEDISFSGGEDRITVWYSPLTPDEAERIRQPGGRPDLAFLLGRPSLVSDEHGVRWVAGQPDEPFYW